MTLANFITTIRLLFSVGLLFCPVFSPVFYAFYIASGIGDMLDGFVARKTNTVSAVGSLFDTAADFVFVAVCMIKILPVLHLHTPYIVWIAIIALMKIVAYLYGYTVREEVVFTHTVLNKITGVILFVFPLTLQFVDMKYSAFFVCLVATVAAVYDVYLKFRR